VDCRGGWADLPFPAQVFWGNKEQLVLSDTRMRSVRKTSFWRGDVAVELPGLAAA
jgi:hypothetical protein